MTAKDRRDCAHGTSSLSLSSKADNLNCAARGPTLMKPEPRGLKMLGMKRNQRRPKLSKPHIRTFLLQFNSCFSARAKLFLICGVWVVPIRRNLHMASLSA